MMNDFKQMNSSLGRTDEYNLGTLVSLVVQLGGCCSAAMSPCDKMMTQHTQAQDFCRPQATLGLFICLMKHGA